MYTDPKRVRADIPGTVEGNPVFTYHDAFNPNVGEVDDLKARYRAGKVGDVEVKTKLANALNAHLDPIRERRAAVLAEAGSAAGDPRSKVRGAPAVSPQRDDGARARRDEDRRTGSMDAAARLRIVRRRVRGPPRQLRGTARSAAAPHQEERGQHLRHPDRAHHRAVSRRHRADAGAQPRRRRRVPGDGGDAHPHQVADAAAAARDRGGGRGRRRGSARRAGAAAARAPEVQGGRRTAARTRAGARRRSGSGRTSAWRRSPATTTSRSSRSTSSAC